MRFIVLLLVAFAACRNDKAPEAEQKPDYDHWISTEPDVLIQNYLSNEVTADDRYKGKTFGIHGRVATVRRDATGKPYAFLKSSRGNVGVLAYLADDSEATGLGAGLEVSFNCVGAGMTADGPKLINCKHQ